MIYYFKPFDTKKRLGYIHNEYCKLVTNPDDYICLLDPDTMFLHPHQQAWIEDIVNKHCDQWDLLGCMTNRIGNNENLYIDDLQWHFKYNIPIDIDAEPLQTKVTFNDYQHIKKIPFHIRKAKAVYEKNADTIKEANIIAGFFMLFKRSLWDKIKFEEGIDFDIKFCNAVKKAGGRIGIMQGIYIFHQYRLLSDNPTKYKKHLL